MLVDFVEAEKAKSARADDKWQGEVYRSTFTAER